MHSIFYVSYIYRHKCPWLSVYFTWSRIILAIGSELPSKSTVGVHGCCVNYESYDITGILYESVELCLYSQDHEIVFFYFSVAFSYFCHKITARNCLDDVNIDEDEKTEGILVSRGWKLLLVRRKFVQTWGAIWANQIYDPHSTLTKDLSFPTILYQLLVFTFH